MSVETDSNIETIFVNLLDEGTVVMRPVQALALGFGVYRLMPPDDYDHEDEHWEFLPGSLVRCKQHFSDGNFILLAFEIVSV
jgi:hypothetical protein